MKDNVTDRWESSFQHANADAIRRTGGRIAHIENGVTEFTERDRSGLKSTGYDTRQTANLLNNWILVTDLCSDAGTHRNEKSIKTSADTSG